jgi:hypothetical protein
MRGQYILKPEPLSQALKTLKFLQKKMKAMKTWILLMLMKEILSEGNTSRKQLVSVKQ